MGLGNSLGGGPNLILHPTKGVTQTTGSQPNACYQTDHWSSRLCPHCSLFAMNLAHHSPLSSQISPLPVLQSFKLLLALCLAHIGSPPGSHFQPPASISALSTARIPPDKLFPISLELAWFIFFCYHSLGSKFRKAWAATYFSVFICLMSVFPTEFYEGGDNKCFIHFCIPVPSTGPASMGTE